MATSCRRREEANDRQTTAVSFEARGTKLSTTKRVVVKQSVVDKPLKLHLREVRGHV